MRLSAIELHGYKSFGKSSQLRFDQSLTAIVGPNGSGKSNVMDALRWVIGESGGRALRARRSDEVVFSGGGGRPPAGFAEVRLRLDNSDRWLDLDASEVEIVRRVDRDGDTVSRLNGRVVRLRDVQDLFRASGLGGGGYALMGQGLVDEVLRLRPLERRRLIEEVADVRRHRRRMDESRRRRQRATEHLSRARTLRTELEPRLQSLQRAANRARRAEQLRSELQEAWHRYFAAAAREAASDSADRRSDLIEAQTQRGKAERKREQTTAAVAVAERGVADARSVLEGAQQAARRAGAEARALEHAQELDTQRLTIMRRELLELDRELADAQVDGEAPIDLSIAEREAAQAQRALRDARAERERLLRRRREHERTEATRVADRAQAQAELVAHQEAARALARRWRAGAGSRMAARQRAAAVDREWQAAVGAVSAARDQTAAASQALSRVEAQAAAWRRERSELEQRLAQLDARLSALNAADERRSAGRIGTDNAAVGRLRSVIRTRRGYEAAIEAALGELAEAELHPDDASALAAAEAALAADSGRFAALVVPLTPANPGRRRDEAVDSGNVVAPILTAASVVEAPPELCEALWTLLDGIVIANDVESARSLLTAGGIAGVATLDGLVLRPGLIAAGGATPGARRRREQIESLQRERADLETQIINAGDPGDLADRLAIERQRVEESEKVLHDAQSAVALVEQRRLVAAAQAAGTNETCRALEREAARLRSRLRQSRRRAAELEQSRASMPQQDGAQERVSPDDLRRLEEERDRAVAAAAEARAQADMLKRRRAAGARRDQLHTEAAQLELAIEARAKSIEAAQAVMEDRQPLTNAEAELSRLQTERGQARSRLDAAQDERVSSERREVEAEAALRAAESGRAQLAAAAAAEGIGLATASEVIEVDPDADPDQLRTAAVALKERLARIGAADAGAQREYEEERERLENLDAQVVDLEQTEVRLRDAERELGSLIDSRFRSAFREVDQAFRRWFELMFRGGQARLRLTDEQAADHEDGAETDSSVERRDVGVEIEATPPGKRVAGLALLSGGERALTAIALLLALLEVRPVPFCVLDEVDAALDEANVERFVSALQAGTADTQFIVITHNRRTIEQADLIYGVTMGADGVSQVLSVRVDDQLEAQ